MKAEHFDTGRQVDFVILKDNQFFAEAWYWGFDGDCHVFFDSGGGNCKYYIRDLNEYAFAQSIH